MLRIMNDSLINIIDSLKLLASNQVRDTVYVIGVNSSKDFIDILPIIIVAIALIISSIATYISKKSSDSNIKHQKLSVVPALNYSEDFTLRPSCEGVGLLIKNSGLGPALIKEFKVSWGKIEINSQDDFSKIPKDKLYGVFAAVYMSKNSVLDKHEEIWILRIPLNNLYLSGGAIDTDKVDKIRTELKNNFTLKILYRSFYDEEEYEYILEYPPSYHIIATLL